jgi:hypothetical protein
MKRRMLVEFDTPEQLALAVLELRALGYKDLDAHTPYSTEVVRDALELRRSPLSFIVLAGALLGAGTAYYIEWGTNAHLYPLDVGGRPPHMPLAFVPICFEMGVLAAAFAAFFGLLAAGGLVKLWDPVFEIEGFESASVDRFWLSVDASGEAFDTAALTVTLEQHRPNRSVLLEERG